MRIFRRRPVEVMYPVPAVEQAHVYHETRTREQREADQARFDALGLPRFVAQESS